MRPFIIFYSLCISALLMVTPSLLQAQDSNAASFETVMRAADSVTLVSTDRRVTLWGVDPVDGMPPVFNLNARTVLSNTIGSSAINCTIKTASTAQCFNDNDIDLGLFMVQQGYVSVNRAAIFNTVYENAYLQAEMNAQDNGEGIWSVGKSGDTARAESGNGSLFMILSVLLFLLVAATFTTLAIIIMRGFKSVTNAQNDNLEMMGRERQLRDKERGIVATMLDSEMKANKSKIEAFIVVYEEMLRSLQDTNKTPKYKSAGDIVQKQPVLSRAVFDRNTDKLDILGGEISSSLIHYYARIKSNPEYVNIEPEMSLTEAVEIVKKSVSRAKKLNTVADQLINAFEKSGVMSDVPQE